MFEHHENYDRYIPDVMLKKHKKHEEYLNDVYAGMSHEEIYKSKLGTVEDALAIIESGDCIVNSIHGCEPRLFYRNLHRIADRIDPNNPVELWSCVHRWGPEYEVHTNPELKDKFHHQTFFYDGNFRKIHPSGMSTYFPVNLHNYGQELHRCKRPNVVVIGVSTMYEHGYCCVSCDLQWEMESLYSADKIIFEVNPKIPHLPGECAVPVAMADVIIESDLDLYELQDPPIGEAEKTVAQYAAEMVHDGDCIQLGFGGIPNAIGFELMDRHDLGIHTEQIGASMAHMIQKGVVTNRYKNLDKGWSVGTFIIADNFTYEYLNNHPRVLMRRGRYTNDPMIIAQQDNMVSINAALQIDLTGQVAAEAIANIQWSGTGGATDYAYGAGPVWSGNFPLQPISLQRGAGRGRPGPGRVRKEAGERDRNGVPYRRRALRYDVGHQCLRRKRLSGHRDQRHGPGCALQAVCGQLKFPGSGRYCGEGWEREYYHAPGFPDAAIQF